MIERLARLVWIAGLALLMIVALQAALDDYPVLAKVDEGKDARRDLLAPTQAITITYWHQHSPSIDRGMLMEQLIAEFNVANSYNIVVQGQYIGGYGDIHNEVIAGLRGDGPLPNVVVAYPNSMADFARYGAVRFLDDYLDDPVAGTLNIPDFSPGVVDYYRLAEYGDQLAGLQHGRSIEVMYYNTHLITSTGITIPTTWNAFETACISITTNSISGTIPGTDASRFATWLWSRGGELLSGSMNHARIDEQPGIESLLLFQNLINDDYARLEYWTYEVFDAFGNGQVGFTFGSSAGIPYYRAAMESGANHTWGVTRVPAVPGHEVVDSYGGGLGILHESEEADLAAWRFIHWLVEPEQTARWAAGSGYFPVRISASTHPSVTQKLAEDSQYAQAYALLPLGRAEPGVRGYNAIRGILNDAITDILESGANVTETLRSAADEADAVLAASGPDSAVIPPSGGTLVYTNTQYMSATVEFPDGALATTQTVSYVPLEDLPTDGLAFALVPSLIFSEPVTVTIHYRDEDMVGMDESTLKLYNYDWPSGSWIHADPCGGYVTDTVNNILQAAVCHFSDYAMMDWPYQVYLPLVLRSYMSPVYSHSAHMQTSPVKQAVQDELEIYSWWTAGGEGEGLNALVDLYKSNFPDVVTVTVLSNRSDFTDRMYAESPPDSFQTHSGEELFSTWVEPGYIEPVTQLWADEGWLDEFPQDLVDMLSHRGNIYCVPVNTHRGNVLWYNPQIFATNTLTPPTTFDEFFAVADALQTTGITAPLALGDSGPWAATHLAESVLLGSMGHKSIVDYGTVAPTLTDQKSMLHLRPWPKCWIMSIQTTACSPGWRPRNASSTAMPR